MGNLMNARDAFGLVIRILGLMSVLWGLAEFMSIVYLWMGARSQGYPGLVYIAAGVVLVVLGMYFLRGAPAIVRFAYPEREND